MKYINKFGNIQNRTNKICVDLYEKLTSKQFLWEYSVVVVAVLFS